MKTPLAETFPSFRDSIRNAADIDATIDFKASFDSLEIMEGVTRHFFLRALIEESMGSQTDWNAVDSLMLKALAAAEKVARYRHAQLSAIKLAGDINAKVTDGASLDDLLVKIKGELEKLKPILGRLSNWRLRASRRGKNETAYPLAQAGLEAPAAAGRHPSVMSACERVNRHPAPCCACGGHWRGFGVEDLARVAAAGSDAWAAL